MCNLDDYSPCAMNKDGSPSRAEVLLLLKQIEVKKNKYAFKFIPKSVYESKL